MTTQVTKEELRKALDIEFMVSLHKRLTGNTHNKWFTKTELIAAEVPDVLIEIIGEDTGFCPESKAYDNLDEAVERIQNNPTED